MKSSLRRWLIVFTLMIFPSSAFALTVPLTVRNELAVPREGATLEVGVPFAQGAISSPDQLGISGPNGTVNALQARTLTQWWDGSPRWVLLTLPVDVPARGTSVYQLSDNGNANGSSALVATDDGTTITVETGVLRFTVDKASFHILETASIDSDGDGSYDLQVLRPGQSAGLVVDGSDGERYTAAASAPTVAEIEHQGSQSVTLLFKGKLQSETSSSQILNYVTRITATLGSAELRIQQTLHNWRPGAIDYRGDGSVAFQDARIELATPFSNGSLKVGADEGSAPMTVSLSSGQRGYIHQDSSGLDSWNKWTDLKKNSYRGWRFYAGDPQSETQVGSGDQAEGWMEVRSGQNGVAFGIDEFWQNYPNGLVAQADGTVKAEFFSEFQSGDHSMRGGEQKTHRIRVDFFSDGGANTQARMLSALNPMIALAPPEYYLGTGCFRRTVPVSESPSPDYELYERAGLYGGIGFTADRPEASAGGNLAYDDVYGWWDYGDFFAEYEHQGDRANCENDYSYGMILQMVRSGNFDWWTFIEPAARHLADIDVYHTQGDLGWRNGGFFTHDRTGSHKHRTDYPQPGHYNAQGMFYYYYLTGDPVVYDSAVEVADNTAWRLANDPNSGGYSEVKTDGEIRAAAWFLSISLEAWRATGEQKYLDACLDVMRRTNAADRCWINGPDLCDDTTFDPPWQSQVSVWQLGMLMGNLGEFLEERERQLGTPDAQGVQSLHTYGNWLQTYCWVPASSRWAYSWDYHGGVTAVADAGLNLRVDEGLSYAYWLTGDASMLVHVPTDWATATKDPWFDGSGITYSNMKNQAVAARNGGAYLQYLLSQGGTSDGCLSLLSTTPDAGESYDPSSSGVLLLFSESLDPTTLQGAVTAEGSSTGSFTVSSQLSSTVLSLNLSPTPQNGETVTFTVSGNLSSLAGHFLDGNGDGSCGDPTTFALTVASSAGPDEVAPDAVDDLELNFDADDGSAVLQWSAPADQGPSGMPSQVEIRYATADPSTNFDWNTATVVANPPAPELPGNVQTVNLGTIDASDGALRVAIRTTDAAGNVSVVSNIAEDSVGPTVVHQGFGSLLVEEGTTATIQLLISDATTGHAAVTNARLSYDSQPAWQGEVVPLQHPVGLTNDVALLYYTVDASNWSAGETHTLRVEGLDMAANWSPNPSEISIEVAPASTNSSCMTMYQSEPVDGAQIASFNGVILRLDQVVDTASMDPSGFTLTFTPAAGGSVDYPVSLSAVSPSELKVTTASPPDEVGTFTLAIDPDLKSSTGAPLGVGDNCDPQPTLSFQLDPNLTPSGCMHIVSTTPTVGSSAQSISEIELEFDEPVLRSSVRSGSFVLESSGGQAQAKTLGLAQQWVSDTLLRLVLDTAISEPASLRLSFGSGIISQSGAPLGDSESCSTLQPMDFDVQGGAGVAPAGSDLANIARVGTISVSGYQVEFSELEPGSTLRIYDTSGHLLREVPIDTDTYTLDTQVLGKFPDKQLIVLYRDKKQHIVVGRDVDPYRSYIGDIE